ncbi:hypothetical protein [Bradyrhizobium sp. USDA 10063]
MIDVGENSHINNSRRKMTKGGLFDHLAVRSSASEISRSSGFPGATRLRQSRFCELALAQQKQSSVQSLQSSDDQNQASVAIYGSLL